MNNLIIYHANCPDGFGSAYIAKKALPSSILFEGIYKKPAPLELAKDKDVYILDFSYPRNQLQELKNVARSLVVLDHHKTAQADLIGFPGCIFDMNQSGIGLTWRHFFPSEEPPWLVQYVEDRDLWRNKLPYSTEISHVIRMTRHTIEDWDNLYNRTIDDVIKQSLYIKDFIQYYIDTQVKLSRKITLNGYSAIIVNTPYELCSDVLHEIIDKNLDIDIAMGWCLDNTKHIKVSLRSRPDVDCSQIAINLGGGGHKNAAGAYINTSVGYHLDLFSKHDEIITFLENI